MPDDTPQTIHDYFGSLVFMLDEPQSVKQVQYTIVTCNFEKQKETYTCI